MELDDLLPYGVSCYCVSCRKISGAACSPVVRVKREHFRVVAGAELLVRYSETPVYERWHCSRCHAPIFGTTPEYEHMPVYIPAGLLEDKDIVHVVFEPMFARSQAQWNRMLDGGQEFDTFTN